MENYAAIDVGSNQVLIYIVKIENGNIKEVLIDEGEITKLGQGVTQTGVLRNDAVERTLTVLKRYKKILEKNHVKSYIAVGTSAIRESKNSGLFLKSIKDDTGIEINVISGEEEARLSFIAAVRGLNLQNKETAVIDIGGGSTEFVFGIGNKIIKRFILKIGSLKMTESFLKSDPVKDEEFDNLIDFLDKEFQKLANLSYKRYFLAGVGGTMSNLGAMKYKLSTYDPKVVHGSKIHLSELKKLIDDVKSMTLEERKRIKGLQPERADVILAGMIILYTIMVRLNAEIITISDMGLRHGLIFDKFCK